MHLLKDISHLKIKKVAIFMATPYDVCLKNNQQRDRHVPEEVINKRILLVDDVYTTGRTLYHAAVLFKQAGCKEIGSVSLAR